MWGLPRLGWKGALRGRVGSQYDAPDDSLLDAFFRNITNPSSHKARQV